MHTLKLRQRVKDVQSKVFKRRSTNETAVQVPTSSSPTRLESLKKRPSIVSLAASSLSRRRATTATAGATTPTTPSTPTASIEGEVKEQEQPRQTVVEEEGSVEDHREELQHHQADPTTATTATTTTITSSTTTQDHKEAKSPSIDLARTNAGEQKEGQPKQQHEHHYHPSLSDPPSPSPSSSSSPQTSSPQTSSRPRSPHQQNPPPSTSSSSQSTASPSSPIVEENPSSQPIQLPASGSHEPSNSPAVVAEPPPLPPQKCTSPTAPSRSSSVTRAGLQFRLPFSDQPTIPESSSATGLFHRPSQVVRRQSLLPATETKLIHALWNTDTTSPLLEEQERNDKLRNFSVDSHNSQSSQVTVMPNKKIWVRRAGQNSSPTGVSVGEEDLVDDVRDAILRKYGNSLGRSFDSPDINLRIYPRANRNRQSDVQRHHGTERLLGPDEVVTRILEEYFPGGQTADEALVIEIPVRRTPRPSPQQLHYPFDNQHMTDGTGDYFSVPISSAHAQGTPVGGVQTVVNPQSISVLSTGQVPIIPGSPGRRATRPGMGRRVNTSSPTMHVNSCTRKSAAERESGPITLQPRKTRSRGSSDATPPERMQEQAPNESPEITPRPNSPDPIRVSSPPPAKSYKKQEKPESPLGHAVPPIKVLIVEDNSINLRLLEAFMKRLRVRWETAMNGRIAVDKWKAGGFHLVLMDIQLPVMSGLEATKEIRRLEKVNQIGIKPLKPLDTPKTEDGEAEEEIPAEDRLGESILFRSPVIIVALTASSLTSDRHEAYAAGCNDFLTKPVNFNWLEKKVTEWGCMQALLDFDGWKAWKEDPENIRLRHLERENKKTGKGKRLLQNKKNTPKIGVVGSST